MYIKRLFVTLLFLALAILVGYGIKQYSKEVVAVVNGKIISEEDIQEEVTGRKITVAFINMFNSEESSSITSRKDLIKALNITEKDLTPSQIRYIEFRERATKLLTNNEALNILLREEVLYKEALKEGYKVSVDEAKQILEENQQLTAEILKNDKDEQQKQNEILEFTKKIYKQFGFESEGEYLEQRIDKIAQTMTINRMKNQFSKTISNKLPKANGLQMEVDMQNAWNDYSEYLMKKAKIEILNTEYSIEIYGDPWSYGTLDLKSK